MTQELWLQLVVIQGAFVMCVICTILHSPERSCVLYLHCPNVALCYTAFIHAC